MKKKNIILILVIIVFLILIYALEKPLRGTALDILSPATSKLTSLGETIKDHFSFIFHIGKLRQENEELYAKITNLNVDRSRILELEHENELLKSELGFISQGNQAQLIPAKVTGREPASFLDHVVIDKGAADGIASGLPAISSGVLIGQIKDVNEHSATVVLITSKDSLILSMLQESREKGILRGGLSGLVLENIAQDVEIKRGEYIITSGLDGQLESGILIGRAGSIQSSTSDLFKNVSVEPIADLSKLEILFIKK